MDEPWKNPVTLARAYDTHGSAEKVAEAWGCSDRTIRTWLHKHDEIQVQRQGRRPSWEDEEPPNHVLEDDEGYEIVESFVPVRDDSGEVEKIERKAVRMHRLTCVAKWGFDAVADMEVHHQDGMKLHNLPRNLIPLEHLVHANMKTARRWRMPWVGEYEQGDPGPDGAPTGDVDVSDE